MKFNTRLLIGNLCAAGSAAVVSAILIAGCATGERTGKFWDKGDIKSSDAYVSAEMSRDQSVAKVDPAPRANGKITPVSGTQDNSSGHVSLDFPDLPPAPPATSLSPAPGTVGASAGGAQNAGAQVGSAQIAGAATGGTIVAPYVQKRPPSGAIDNSRHDSEIMKPNPVFAKQLDPFAATEGGPFAAPASAAKPKATVGAIRVSKPVPAAVAVAVPVAVSPSAAPPAAPQVDVSATLSAGQTPIELVPNTQPGAPSIPASTFTARDAFDPSTPPAGGASSGASRSASIVLSRSHSGVRLGDEDLDTDQQSSAHEDEKQIVESQATQVAEAPPSAASNPYEADTHHEAPNPAAAANNSGCVTVPAAPVRPPASVTAPAPTPPSPPQDSWESTKVSTPARSVRDPIQQPVPVPVYAYVTSVAPAVKKPVIAQPARQTSELITRAPLSASVAPHFVAATKPVENERPQPAAVRFEQSPTSGGSDPMICDSASIHGRYTGADASQSSAWTRDPFDVPLQKSSAILSPPPTNAAAPRAKKPNAPIENKSTSWWDDALSSSSKNIVRTADFSVAAPPLPFDADDTTSNGAKPGSPPQLAAHSSHSGSRRSLLIGMVLGLAVSAVVWRRWRRDRAV